jgi:GTP-binding protein YchF
MELGLIGLPRAGKTTLFGALTGLAFDAGAARASHTAVVRVPDPRIERLSAIFQPRKTTLAEVTFVDPAGEHRDAGAERVAFPETMAAALREVDALVHVVRAFDDPSVPAPPGGGGSPGGDVEAIEQELVLRDLTLVERRLERLRKERGKPENAAEQALLEQAFAHLDAARPLRDIGFTDDQWGRLRGFQFLSSKPALVVLNIGESDLATAAAANAAANGVPGLERFRVLRLCARVEREIAELGAEDQREFLTQMGLEQPARDVFIRSAYELLRLLSFFTVGEDEVRAWPVADGATAWVAAGKIHSDIQRGFIRAEAIHYEEFLRCGSLTAAKTKGLLRLEGKEYRVRDGDILHFRFSV